MTFVPILRPFRRDHTTTLFSVANPSHFAYTETRIIYMPLLATLLVCFAISFDKCNDPGLAGMRWLVFGGLDDGQDLVSVAIRCRPTYSEPHEVILATYVLDRRVLKSRKGAVSHL